MVLYGIPRENSKNRVFILHFRSCSLSFEAVGLIFGIGITHRCPHLAAFEFLQQLQWESLCGKSTF